jgi:molybdate transport system regulatory protein
MVRLALRIEFDEERAIGPGKARLLELIQVHRSIAAAGRAMGMSYRRAWLLVDDLNRCFDEPVVQAQHGGRAGGGASLTPFGQILVEHFRAIEKEAEGATRKRITALRRKLSDIAPARKG